MNKKLEPCPFCGGEARLHNYKRHGDHWSVRCAGDDCKVYPGMYGFPTMEEAIAAWNRRAAPEVNEACADCSGITYRQTASGKVVPASHICPSKITPPCYQPDGDGCAYQTYGDGGEPIDKCKECPLCYTDKVRHEANEPLTLEELRGMGQQAVWWSDTTDCFASVVIPAYHDEPIWVLTWDAQTDKPWRRKAKRLMQCGYRPYRRPPEGGEG